MILRIRHFYSTYRFKRLSTIILKYKFMQIGILIQKLCSSFRKCSSTQEYFRRINHSSYGHKKKKSNLFTLLFLTYLTLLQFSRLTHLLLEPQLDGYLQMRMIFYDQDHSKTDIQLQSLHMNLLFFNFGTNVLMFVA